LLANSKTSPHPPAASLPNTYVLALTVLMIEGIVEFVDRRVLDHLLGNLPVTTFPQSLDEYTLPIAVPVTPTFRPWNY
jgi:hypothetical protein